MRRKSLKHRLIKAMIPVMGIGAVSLPMCAPLTVFAEESVITQERVDELKAAYEQAKAEYDAASKNQQAARDVVVNAERTRDEAQEKYEEVLVRYKKGTAGFLQWVIENGNTDTWEEEFKIVEAQQTLADLDLPGYENVLGEQTAGLFSFYDVNADIMGTAESTTNLSRMYYSLDWMEEVEKNVALKNLPEVKTSHGAMMTALDFATFIGSYHSGNLNEVVDFKEMEVQDMYDFYGGARFYYMLLSDKNAQISEDGMPELNHYSDVFPEELYNFTVQEKEAVEYSEEYNRYTWGNPYEFVAENPVMGFARGTSEQGEFIVWVVAEENMSNFLPTYTLDEYIQTLREYYSITDPQTSKLAIIAAENDIADAGKEFSMADEMLSASAARLKDAEKEYEEAVALFESLPAEETETEVPVIVQEEIPQEDVVPAEINLPEAEAVVSEDKEELVMPVIDGSTVVNTASEALTISDGDAVTVINSENAHLSVTSGDNNKALIGEAAAVSETLVADEDVAASETVMVNELAADSESGITSDITLAEEAVTEADEAVVNDDITVRDEPVVRDEAVVKNENIVKNNNAATEKQQKNHILAEVLSYIFNGGAIALILPAGFKRRKKGTGEILI